MRKASNSSQKLHLWVMRDHSVTTHWTGDVGRGVMPIRMNYFDISILLTPEEVGKRRRQNSLFQTWRVRTHRQIRLNEIGIRAKKKNDWNLQSRAEQQCEQRWDANQASLWGEGYGLQDPAAGPQTQAITQPFDILLEDVLDATVCFIVILKNMWWLWSTFLSPVTPFKQKTLIFLVLQPLENLSVALPALQQEIVCVSCYGSQ